MVQAAIVLVEGVAAPQAVFYCGPSRQVLAPVRAGLRCRDRSC
jgi:hypothetical protein